MIRILIFVFLVFCIAAQGSHSALCQGEDSNAKGNGLLYEAKQMRDPFLPLITKDGKVSSSYGRVNTIADVRLQGIVFDPKGESIAIINGTVLRKGESVGTVKILDIRSNEVELLLNQSNHIIKLEE